MWFNIDFNKLAVLSLPTLNRKQIFVSYLFCLIKPLVTLHYNWLQFRKDNIYKTSHNSQVCYLRKALNDRFDSQKRRIIITGSHRYNPQYIYTEPEQKDRYLGTMYLRMDSDYADNGADFLVLVPAALLDTDNFEMKALIDYYRLASKRYRIEEL